MKVVQLVTARQFRGAEIFAAQLSRELVNSGVEVRYVSLYKTTGTEFIPDKVHCNDLNGVKGSIINLSLLYRLRKYVTQFNPEVVQANAGDTLKYAVLLKLIFGLKYKIVFRNASLVSRYIRSPFQKMFNSFLYRNTDLIVSVSRMSKEDLQILFPFTKNKIAVIPNGIDNIPFSKIKAFANQKINIVHVGGFTFEKNHEGLLRIFVQIKKKLPDSLLWLIGDGPLKPQIMDKVKALNLEHDVRFIAAVLNPLDYIYSANILVLPSLIEGLPGVILEAFYCKTPVVAFDVGGIGEVINKETGWLVKSGDEDGFVDSILGVLNTDTSGIKENAYRLVVGEFDNKVIARRFLEVYENIL